MNLRKNKSLLLLGGVVVLLIASIFSLLFSGSFRQISFMSGVNELKIAGSYSNAEKLLFDTTILDNGFLLRDSESQQKQDYKKLKIVIDSNVYEHNQILSKGAVMSSTAVAVIKNTLVVNIGISPELVTADKILLGHLIDRQLIDVLVTIGRPELKGDALLSEIKSLTTQYEQFGVIQIR